MPLLTKEEAIIAAMALNFAMDILTQTTGRKVTLDNLDQIVQDEEVRSKILEAQRRQ